MDVSDNFSDNDNNSDSDRIKVHGLQNFGATCYANSIIQILLSIPEICNLTRVNDDERMEQTEVCIKFISLIRSYMNEHLNPMILRDFVAVFFHHNAQFRDGQQDQHEFLSMMLSIIHDTTFILGTFRITGNITSLVDKLEMDALDNLRIDGMSTSNTNLKLDKTRQTGISSVIFEIFTGQFHQRTECVNKDCGHISHRFETFRSWEVPINGDTLYQCLKRYTAVVQLDGGDTYECEKCKHHNRSLRKSTLWRLPKILTICIKRFNAVSHNGTFYFKRDHRSVDVPHVLDVSPFMTLNEPHNYKLFAIAHHVGELNRGHCYSHVKKGDSWYEIDDENVNLIREPFTGSSAYILFYRLN